MDNTDRMYFLVLEKETKQKIQMGFDCCVYCCDLFNWDTSRKQKPNTT